MLSAQSVADYLEQNPGFFEQHIDLLTRLHLPHPHGGRTVSIAERQVVALRDQVRSLEQQVQALLGHGRQNDALGDKVHALACRLLSCRGADAIADAARASLLTDFAVPAVALRLWAGGHGAAPAGATLEPVPSEVRDTIAALEQPYMGADPVAGTADWFGDGRGPLRSFAVVPLRAADGATLGVIALASEDAERFHASQGTQHLARIGALVGCALASQPDHPG